MLRTKQLNHKGHRFEIRFAKPDIITVRYPKIGYTGHVSVGRNLSPNFPYYYTKPEATPTRHEVREIPTTTLLEAVRGCCDGILQQIEMEKIRKQADRGKAVETMHIWFESLPDPEDEKMSGATLE